ncbi:hypothetical protein EDB89DRAFT_1914350 [Lactarius sanguifluus]|nr:hypothetical protein EDB89DRAFT_1914350 [Lactarius sanguifluus]
MADSYSRKYSGTSTRHVTSQTREYTRLATLVDISGYNHLFLVHQGRDGTPAREVPAPMVALVATAMYATLHEWHTGTPQVFEFSANTYLEVYRSNTDTLNFILNNWPNAYHLMMADIYTQASSNSGLDDSPNVKIADLDLDNLEE